LTFFPPKPGLRSQDANWKPALGKFVGRAQPGDPASQNRRQWLHLGTLHGRHNWRACLKISAFSAPSLRPELGTTKRRNAARPDSQGGRGGVGARCGDRGSREPRDFPPRRPAGTPAPPNAIQAPFAATGDDDGQLSEPNTTEVSAWGGSKQRLTMFEEIGVPAGRWPCSRTLL
jgi:hypothetical protein